MIEKIKRIRIVSFILRLFNPGFSYCEKCKLPWNYCQLKSVNYNNDAGTFATCEYCWNHSNLIQLKKYYTNVYKMQKKQIILCGYQMDHTLEQLLIGVEKEYIKTKGLNKYKKEIRKEKLKTLKNEN